MSFLHDLLRSPKTGNDEILVKHRDGSVRIEKNKYLGEEANEMPC